MNEDLEHGGLSRRSLLAKSAAAGGLVWAAPAILASPAGAATVSDVVTPSCGSIVSTTGNLEVVAPPASAVFNAYESDNLIRVWQEQASTTIGPGGVLVDEPGGGTMTLPAGTQVGVYFFHYDRAHGQGSKTATVTFSTPIVGLVRTTSKLNNTDIYGASGTTYPTGQPGRGTEDDDTATLASSTTSVTLRGIDFDQVRVFVACEGTQ